ncbi:MAG: ankyrin repeat domain-containing protein [Aeromicrobium sp.]
MSPDPALVDVAVGLFDVARRGDVDALEAAFEAGVPIELVDAGGNSYLMLAAYHGHRDAVSAMVARGADVDRLNQMGQSPLAGAVFKGHDAVVRVLVDAGANADLGRPSAREMDASVGGDGSRLKR